MNGIEIIDYNGEGYEPTMHYGEWRVAFMNCADALVKLNKYLKYDFVPHRIPADDTFYYSNDGQRQWNIAPGKFAIKVGASSQDIRLTGEVNLKGKTVVKPLRDYYFSESTIN